MKPTTLFVYAWTESFAPIVNQAMQKFYVYGYYGNEDDFPYKAAFDFPVDMSTIKILQNTTLNNKVTNGVIIKSAAGAADSTGFYTFTILSKAVDQYYY